MGFIVVDFLNFNYQVKIFWGILLVYALTVNFNVFLKLTINIFEAVNVFFLVNS
jgi:hypothetical protein